MGRPLSPAAHGAAAAADVGVYLPQVGFTWDELRDRVRLCDREGIPSVWFMDHLYPPGLPSVPSFEAWTTATALAAATERIRLGHLVLANGFRHPALLAKMAVTLDHASGGRLDLGLGTGSYPDEFARFGVDFPVDRVRAEQLGRSAPGAAAAVHGGGADVRRPALPARRRTQPAPTAAAPAPADPRRRRRRAPHAAARRASRRRLELPDLRARRSPAEARRPAEGVRRRRARSGEPARHRGSRARARAACRSRGRRPRARRCGAFPGRAGASRRAATAARPTRSCAASRSAVGWASAGSSSSCTTAARPETLRLLAREVVPAVTRAAMTSRAEPLEQLRRVDSSPTARTRRGPTRAAGGAAPRCSRPGCRPGRAAMRGAPPAARRTCRRGPRRWPARRRGTR